jgi:trk system potassium uptake protein TrkA
MMNIIIVGCGKVGYTIAEQLSEEGHELTIIDSNEQRLQYVASNLDVIGVIGNGTSYRIQQSANIEKADLLIAVTSSDEVNMLSCLIAKKAGDCKTIARVRNPEYYEEIDFIRNELGLTMSINPELAAAVEMARLIHFPSAIEIDTFAKGRVNMMRIHIPENSVLSGKKVADIQPMFSHNILICIVERSHTVTIPDGNFVLESGDVISLITPMGYVHEFFKKIGIRTKPIKNVIIAGGGEISYYLAKGLLSTKINVKIIEKNEKRCEQLCEALPHAVVINGDATERSLLMEEGIDQCDAFISLTNMDEENILLSLFVEHTQHVKKVITKINRITYDEIVDDMPVGSVICPKNITAEYILRYVRSHSQAKSDHVAALYRMMDNKVEALEFIINENDRITRNTLSELNFRSNVLVCCISRNRKIIIPSGKDQIQPDDSVIVVTTQKGLTCIDDILAR